MTLILKYLKKQKNYDRYVRKFLKMRLMYIGDEIMEDKKVNLVFGIIKAILWFIFRLLLLIPMVMLGIAGVILSGSEETLVEVVWRCVTHPFVALIDTIKNIKYEIDVYKE